MDNETIRNQLTALIDDARKSKKWLCAENIYWFSPDELENEIKNNRFLWPLVHWKKRKPEERLQELQQELRRARWNIKTFKSRITKRRKELIKTFLKKVDYDRGHKRVMLYLTIPEAEILSELSSLKSIRPASLVRMIAIEGLRKAKALYPSNTLPGQQELFEKKKGKKKNDTNERRE